MSIFVQNKVLQGILLKKKSASEAHGIIFHSYDDNAILNTTCKYWFRCFKNNDFHLGRQRTFWSNHKVHK